MIDEGLKQFASARQLEYINAINTYGSVRSSAKKLGVTHQAVQCSVRALKRRAALQGYSPEHGLTKTVPSPFVVRGTSTLYDKDGAQKLQWVKTRLDDDLAEEAIRSFVEALASGVKGLSPHIAGPSHSTKDLIAVYPFGDPHFGLYAWKDESGEDFNLDIAEELTKAAVDRLVDCAPAADVGLLLELGDFFHMDSSTNTTARSNNALDVDTRWAKVMQVGLRTMIHCILRMLSKHEKVVVRINKGNHDTHSSFALALALDAYFSKDDRVTVDLSPSVYWYYRFGDCLIGSTHGDTAKMDKLPGVMACDVPKDWGDTRHRYWYCGHVHHIEVREYPGVVVEYFRTLAARDAWHSGQGYRAGRDMGCIVLHRKHGMTERHRCDVGMLT